MSRTQHTRHSTTIAAAPQEVYDLIVDVSRWPALFLPTIHAERMAGDETDERIRLWALANDDVRTWTSRRRLDRCALRVEFRQEIPSAPVAAMSGGWYLEPLPDGRTAVLLTHDFSAVGDDEDSMELIGRAVERNSISELESLRLAAEQRGALDNVVLSFADELLVDGPLDAVYDFIHQSDAWPERVPHVSRLELREKPGGLQFMEMDTRSADGSVHTTESVRICFPGERIVYKQTRVPPIMNAHVGTWTFRSTPQGTVVTSSHTVVIKPEAATELLGHDATIADVRERVHAALSANSTTTMRCAKEHVERVATTTR